MSLKKARACEASCDDVSERSCADFELLPEEIFAHIISFLREKKDLKSLRSVNKHFWNAVSDSGLLVQRCVDRWLTRDGRGRGQTLGIVPRPGHQPPKLQELGSGPLGATWITALDLTGIECILEANLESLNELFGATKALSRLHVLLQIGDMRIAPNHKFATGQDIVDLLERHNLPVYDLMLSSIGIDPLRCKTTQMKLRTLPLRYLSDGSRWGYTLPGGSVDLDLTTWAPVLCSSEQTSVTNQLPLVVARCENGVLTAGNHTFPKLVSLSVKSVIAEQSATQDAVFPVLRTLLTRKDELIPSIEAGMFDMVSMFTISDKVWLSTMAEGRLAPALKQLSKLHTLKVEAEFGDRVQQAGCRVFISDKVQNDEEDDWLVLPQLREFKWTTCQTFDLIVKVDHANLLKLTLKSSHIHHVRNHHVGKVQISLSENTKQCKISACKFSEVVISERDSVHVDKLDLWGPHPLSRTLERDERSLPMWVRQIGGEFQALRHLTLTTEFLDQSLGTHEQQFLAIQHPVLESFKMYTGMHPNRKLPGELRNHEKRFGLVFNTPLLKTLRVERCGFVHIQGHMSRLRDIQVFDTYSFTHSSAVGETAERDQNLKIDGGWVPSLCVLYLYFRNPVTIRSLIISDLLWLRELYIHVT
eukprot:Colp12_sorted_trinity150504_noHs@1764